MSWTKRQFIEEAFSEIGLASYVFDVAPEQMQSALARLDSMMATWNTKGIRIGYPLPSSQQASNLDDETNVPDTANEAIYTNLAIKLAPGIGKTPTRETKVAAKMAYDTLISNVTAIPQQQFPSTLPRGAGNKPWRYTRSRFFPEPEDPITVGPDSELDL